MITRAAARARIEPLVVAFGRNEAHYRSGDFDEAKVRVEFLDPFFKALGWDVHNEAHKVGREQDVIVEDRARVRGARRRPDYGFRIGGELKFFVEAKKPSVSIDDAAAAFQVKSCAWSAGAPLALLTNFSHLRGFDGTLRPEKEAAEAGRLLDLDVPFTSYLERFDTIYDVLSREAVAGGNLDRFLERERRGRRAPARKALRRQMDEDFLADLERWREHLATELARRNDFDSGETLADSTQRILDRLLFLRVCEDRGIEPREILRTTLLEVRADRRRALYPALVKLFRRLAPQYNGTLFAPHPSEQLRIDDDAVLADVIEGMYDPAPYRFDVVPVELLGSVYERFLGSTIQLTPRGGAKVEQKAVVRHAGGVYYTPRYIVDAIVARTLGPITEGRTPEELLAVRVLDPACGSGGFLLAAFEHLVERHEAFYLSVQKKPGRYRNDFIVREGVPKLTLRRKQEILTHCIFGVDLDAQAVEVAHMSLYLKLLEGERDDTLGTQMDLRATYLPTLTHNIRRGNSLIAPQDIDSIDDDAWEPHAFDWKSTTDGFGRVFADPQRAGFDAIVGNPPYVRIQELGKWAPREAAFYKLHYKSAKKGNFDLYIVFLERALSLLAPDGRLGFILPNKFFANDYAEPLREMLVNNRHLNAIFDFGAQQVFENATTYTCLLFLGKRPQSTFEYAAGAPEQLTNPNERFEVETRKLSGKPWLMMTPDDQLIWAKLHENSRTFEALEMEMNRGSSTGDDDVFVLTREGADLRASDGSLVTVEPELLRRPIWASDFGRYLFRPSNPSQIIYPYHSDDAGRVTLIPEQELRRLYPQAYRYLAERRARLEKRKGIRDWYGFSAARSLAAHEAADFLVPLLAIRGSVAPVPRTDARFCLMASGGFSVTLPSQLAKTREAVLAWLNSDLTFWVLRKRSSAFRGGWLTCTKQFFEQLPLPDALLQDAGLRARLEALTVRAREERSALQHEVSTAHRTPAELEVDELFADLVALSPAERGRVFVQTRIGAKAAMPAASSESDADVLARMRAAFGAWTAPTPTAGELSEARREFWDGFADGRGKTDE